MKKQSYWAAMAFFVTVRRQLIVAALVGTGALVSTIALLGSSGWLISAASLQPPVMTLEVAIVAVRTFGLSRSILRYSERLMSHKAAFAALTEIRARVFDAMERVAPSGAVTFGRGDVLARVVSDVDRLADFPLRVFMPVVSGGITIVVTSVAAWLILPSAGVLFALVLIVSALVMSTLVIRGHARSANELAPLQGELTASTLNVFDGITEIAALGQQDQALAELISIDDKLVTRSLTNVRAQSFGQSFSLFAQGGSVLGAIIFGAQALSTGELDGRMLAVLVLIPLAMFEAVSSIPQALITSLDLRPSVERITEIINEQPRVIEPSSSTKTNELRAVELNDVSAQWTADSSDSTGIKQINFSAAHSQLTGIVGPSGSGKSTIAAVLVRFLETSQGTYSLDGIDVHELASDNVRELIGLFDATHHIFSTSVLENIRIADPHITKEDALALLQRVQLDDWVSRLPEGIDTQIGDRGAAMSGGERQRLLLARAFAGSHSMLILDEPTEYLDTESAANIISVIATESTSRGVILITHRLSDLEQAHSVMVVEQGRTIATGSFTELVSSNKYFGDSVADEVAAISALARHK